MTTNSELAGHPDLVTQQDIDQYVEDILVQYGHDLREGAAGTDVRDFLRRLRDGARGITSNAFVKNNYTIPGRRGARVLEEIEVKDGIYIVGAYNLVLSVMERSSQLKGPSAFCTTYKKFTFIEELEALHMLDDEIGEIGSDLDFANEADVDDEEGESLSDSS
eukprot:jgi/Phyca11/18263/fgenesh1_pg.PHYCAscaffold_34_\